LIGHQDVDGHVPQFAGDGVDAPMIQGRLTTLRSAADVAAGLGPCSPRTGSSPCRSSHQCERGHHHQSHPALPAQTPAALHLRLADVATSLDRSSAYRVGINTADAHRKYPHAITCHRQHRRRVRHGAGRSHRHLDVWESEVAPGDLANLIYRAPRRIWVQIHRPRLSETA